MKRVLVNSPCSNDGISFFRIWGPLYPLQKSGDVQLITFSGKVEDYQFPGNYLSAHLAFMNRPVFKHQSMYFVEQCRKFSIPIWLDWDDNLFQIREDNPNYFAFADEETRKYMDLVLRNVDIVSVTSQMEGERLKKEHGVKEYVVIENALTDNLIKYRKKYNIPNEAGRFSWRGAPSHDYDLREFEDELATIFTRRKSWDVAFFGMYPHAILRKTEHKNIKWQPTIHNIYDYYLALTHYNANIQMVPLQDTYFNHVKSDLAWLDATLAGSVSIGPAWEEWNKPGMVTYNNNAEFQAISLSLTDKHSDNAKRVEDAWEYILENRLLSRINTKRLELINNLGC